MILGQHVRDRFYQRYGLDLTVEILLELRDLAVKAPAHMRFPNSRPECEDVVVHWRGADIKMVWAPARRFILTFLPQRAGLRLAAPLPKRRRR